MVGGQRRNFPGRKADLVASGRCRFPARRGIYAHRSISNPTRAMQSPRPRVNFPQKKKKKDHE